MKRLLVAVVITLIAVTSNAEPLKMSDIVFSDDPLENSVIRRMDFWTKFYLARRVPYGWGANWSIYFDCSGGIETICRKSGIGHLPRTTSERMWRTWANKKRWTINKEMWQQSRFPYLIFYTFPSKPGKPPRPYGHVCFAWKKDDLKVITIAEASSSAGYFKETLMRKKDYHDQHWVGLLQLNLLPGK